MSLRKELSGIIGYYGAEVMIIHDFLDRMKEFVDPKQCMKKCKVANFSKDEAKEFKTLIESDAFKVKGGPKGGVTVTLDTDLMADKYVEAVFSLIAPVKYEKIVAEMSLSYLITYQEAYIKDYMRTLLISRKELMKSEKKTASYETLCDINSIDDLFQRLADEEVNRLGTSIDSYAQYYKNQPFKLRLEDFSDYEKLQEANYRRHLIVHNQSVTNETYCRATGYKKQGEKLKTTISYTNRISLVLIDFFEFFDSEMVRRLKIK